METPGEIEITIDYELTSGETGHLDLLPREYFDEDAIAEASGESPASELDVDSEPLHYDSAGYLDAAPEQLKSAKLSIRNKGNGRLLSYNTSYWNQGKNQITAKTEWNEGVIVEEAITFSITTGDNPAASHIVRTVASEGVHAPVYHRVFTLQANGEEGEEVIL